MKEETKNKPGKPWNVAATFDTYQEADQYRNEKLSLWEKKETKGMQVKVNRRRSNNKFVVKTRLHPDFEPVKKEKKRGKRKSRKSRKGNSEEGKPQINEASI